MKIKGFTIHRVHYKRANDIVIISEQRKREKVMAKSQAFSTMANRQIWAQLKHEFNKFLQSKFIETS